MTEKEVQRQKMQDSLDAKKTQKERNLMGQFSTPYPLAIDIMQYIHNIIGKNDVSFIEPSIGTGVFYSAFTEVFTSNVKQVLGFDIDPHYLEPAKSLWKGMPIELRCADFLTQQPDDLYDMLVANPPYVRHHYIDGEVKVRLQNAVFRQTGIKISGLAGLYCYFMMLSSVWLKEGGISCWLIPSEFMDVNYGKAVKSYLLNNVELLHIHRFDSDDLQFADALVSSSVVVFRNTQPSLFNDVEFSFGGSLNEPKKIKKINVRKLKADVKWTPFFMEDTFVENTQVTLGDFFIVKRGIATGDNGFFIIDKDIVDKYEIPLEFLRPVLPSPRYIKGNCINNDKGLPVVENPQFLFSCNLPENILRERYPKVWEYILLGYEKGVPKGYICSHRSPWYFCEEREPASIVVPYMGRPETKNRMFRFILNTSKAITTNVYLLLYPRPQFEHCMADKQMLTKVWHELNAIPIEVLSRNSRFYGGGLHKLEPSELMRTPVNGIASLLTQYMSFKQLSLFE